MRTYLEGMQQQNEKQTRYWVSTINRDTMSDTSRHRDKLTNKREFILHRQSVGRNEPSSEITGECIRNRDCMDTVAMQMVYVERGGSAVEGQRYKQGENKDALMFWMGA